MVQIPGKQEEKKPQEKSIQTYRILKENANTQPIRWCLTAATARSTEVEKRALPVCIFGITTLIALEGEEAAHLLCIDG